MGLPAIKGLMAASRPTFFPRPDLFSPMAEGSFWLGAVIGFVIMVIIGEPLRSSGRLSAG